MTTTTTSPTSPKKKKRRTSYRRVSWPMNNNNGNGDDEDTGGEFRITWKRLIAIAAGLAVLLGLFPAYWTFSDHWMNKQEIQKALGDHASHDESVQEWNTYGFAANRTEYLEDKSAECEIKKAVKGVKLSPDDVAICARYEAKLKAKTEEAAALKQKAMESTKEKK